MQRRRFLLAAAAAITSPIASQLAQASTRNGGEADVLIGQVAPFRGPQAHYGLAMATGIRAKFNAVNAAGGVRGRTLRLLTADDSFIPSKTVTAYNSLSAQGVVAFCGNFGTPTTIKALPWIAAHKTPVVGVYSGSSVIRSPVNPYIFNLRGSLSDEASAIRRLLDPQGIQRIAVIFEDDAYGAAGLASIRHAYSRHIPSAKVAIGASPAQVRAVADNVLLQHPQVIVLVMTTKIGIAMVEALHEAGFRGIRQQIVAMSGIGPQAFAAGLAAKDRGDVLISTIVPYPWMDGFVANNLTLAYHDDMVAAGQGAAIGFSSFEGYIDACVLVLALQHAKAVTAQGLVDSLNNLGSFDLDGGAGGYPMNLAADNHMATSYANVVSIRPDGRFMNL